MSDLQSVGSKALLKTPQPLHRALQDLNVQFRGEDGPTQSVASPNSRLRNLAGVAPRSPNVVSVMDPQAFRQAPEQLVTHEGTHIWQNNLPPALQAKIPPDNPNDPYNYGGTKRIANLVRSGGTLLDLPKEQAAAAMQYGQVHGMPEPYNSLAHTMDKIPLSQIDMTDPNAKTLNTHPRAPLVPPSTVPGMNFAQQTYAKGQPAPGDDPYAPFVPQVSTGTVGGHAPEAPNYYAEGTSNPPADDPYAQYANQSASPEAPQERYSTQLFKSIPGAAKSFGKGLLEGAGNDVYNIGNLLSSVPYVGPKIAPSPEAKQHLQSLITPTDPAQSLGKGVEQTGEFLIPGAAEEGLAAKAAEYSPRLVPLARIGAQTLSSGLVNKAQGGNFGSGAAVGAAGGLLGEGMRAAAPTLAEKAIGIRGKFDRSFNKEPGRALLDETRGISPENIATQAKNKIGDLSNEMRSLVANSPNTVSLVPARTELKHAADRAISQNAGGTYGQINNMENSLLHRFDTKQLIPDSVTPEDALNLRQGFDQEHLRWNPDIHEPASAAGRRAYGALTGEIHNAVPGTAALDERVSNLIPVARRAQTTALNENTGAKILGRFGAHTGALTGAGLGAYGGYREGGAKGAVTGGLLGVAVPEFIASPHAQLFAARTFNNPNALIRPLGGAILNAGRNLKQEDNE